MRSLKSLRVLCLLLLPVCRSQSEPQFNEADPLGLQYQVPNDQPYNLNIKNKKSLGSETFNNINNDKCFCIPNDIEFSKIYQDNLFGHDLKRLVVYLYKDDQGIQTHIPNKDKQILIPDMLYETNGVLPWMITENVNTMLYPNIYTPDDEYTNLRKEYVQATPRDNRINVYKNFENFAPNLPPPVFRYDDGPVTEKAMFDDINKDLPQNPLINILKYIHLSKPSDGIHLREQDIQGYINTENEKVPLDSEEMTVDPALLEISQRWKSPEQLKGDAINTHMWEEFIPYINKKENENDPKDLKTIDYVENMPASGVVDWEAVVPEFVHKYWFKPGQGITSITFDGWFTNELNRILMGSSIKNNIDSYKIKYLIEKTLNENGMYIRNDGVLTDSLGIALSWGNLKLRPILIGNSAEYGNLVRDQNRDDLNIPKGVPYLKAVLLTLIYPPKVLGIIPLGLTYLPRESSNMIPLPLDKTLFHKSRFNIRTCTNGHCYSTQLSPGETKRDPLFRKVNNAFEPKLEKNDAVQDVNIPQDADFLKSYKSVFPFDLIHGIPRYKSFGAYRRVDGKNLISDKKQLGLFNNEYPKKVEQPIEVEEKPDFRIIGGNSATSSGSALNVKGRAGFIPLH